MSAFDVQVLRFVLPPRASRIVLEPPPKKGGSAKSLGLVREDDGENTATVTRGTPSKADWTDGSDTLDRKAKPAAKLDDEDNTSDGDGPATVLNGQKKITAADLAPCASSDDDDLNETKRADDDGTRDDAETPVGLKKISTPLPMPAPTAKATPVNVAASETEEPAPPAPPQPESGQTRVAPIVAPPTMSAHSINTPPQAWVPPSVPPVAMPPQGPMVRIALGGKTIAVPPHKLALGISLTLMVAALMFVFVRSRAPAPIETQSQAAQFPPPVEVLPPAAMQPPPPTLVLPPTQTFQVSQLPQAQPQPTSATKAPPVRLRTPTRATSRSTIPVHREQ